MSSLAQDGLLPELVKIMAFKKRFRVFLGFLGLLGFLGFNVRTVARDTLDTVK